MVGTKQASRTICRTVDSMVVFMGNCNSTYCHQGIKNADRNNPASWIDVDSIALQGALPLSKVGYLELIKKIIAQTD